MTKKAALPQFWAFVNQFVLFSNAEKETIAESLQYQELPRTAILTDLGQVAKQAYFILSGSIRFYYITESGKEITGFIFTENMFASSMDSYFNQLPSNQVVETIEPCQVLTLSIDQLNLLYQSVPRMNELLRKVFQQRLSHAQKVVESLISLKPEERYQLLLAQRPDLISRIPQHILATYLGITPVSLSRIRSRR